MKNSSVWIKYLVIGLVAITVAYFFLKKNDRTTDNMTNKPSHSELPEVEESLDTNEQNSGAPFAQNLSESEERPPSIGVGSGEVSENDYYVQQPTLAEIRDEKERGSFSACRYIDGMDTLSKVMQRGIVSKEMDTQRFEGMLRLSYSMAVGSFQLSLPASFQYYEQSDRGETVRDIEQEHLLKRRQLELVQNLPKAREVALRAYYAMMLARVTYKNPQMMGDPEITSICDRLKNNNENLQRAELNAIMYNYMQRAQIKPADIKFNPSFVPAIEIVNGPDGPTYIEKTKKENL